MTIDFVFFSSVALHEFAQLDLCWNSVRGWFVWLMRGDTFLSADRHSYEMKHMYGMKKKTTGMKNGFQSFKDETPKHFEDEVLSMNWWLGLPLSTLNTKMKHFKRKWIMHIVKSKNNYFDCCVIIIIIIC